MSVAKKLLNTIYGAFGASYAVADNARREAEGKRVLRLYDGNYVACRHCGKKRSVIASYCQHCGSTGRP